MLCSLEASHPNPPQEHQDFLDRKDHICKDASKGCTATCEESHLSCFLTIPKDTALAVGFLQEEPAVGPVSNAAVLRRFWGYAWPFVDALVSCVTACGGCCRRKQPASDHAPRQKESAPRPVSGTGTEHGQQEGRRSFRGRTRVKNPTRGK